MVARIAPTNMSQKKTWNIVGLLSSIVLGMPIIWPIINGNAISNRLTHTVGSFFMYNVPVNSYKLTIPIYTVTKRDLVLLTTTIIPKSLFQNQNVYS